MSERMTRTLVIDAFTLKRRNPPPGLIHHSDRGSQYASADFQSLLGKHGAICGMNRKGNCWDNAAAESFFALLKRSLVFHNQYQTRAQARQSIFDYIERFYNRKRIHSSLGYRTPIRGRSTQTCSLTDCPRFRGKSIRLVRCKEVGRA